MKILICSLAFIAVLIVAGSHLSFTLSPFGLNVLGTFLGLVLIVGGVALYALRWIFRG